MSNQPNRWHTPVCCKVVVNREVVTRRTFSDLQMAYLWVEKQVQRSTHRDWSLTPFEQVCHELEVEYNLNRGGICPAIIPTDSRTYYQLEYQPQPLH